MVLIDAVFWFGSFKNKCFLIKCFLRPVFDENFLTQSGHLNAFFSPACNSTKWDLRLSWPLNCFSHILHSLATCLNEWFLRIPFVVNLLLHWLHSNGLWSVCLLAWALSPFFSRYFLWHNPHEKILSHFVILVSEVVAENSWFCDTSSELTASFTISRGSSMIIVSGNFASIFLFLNLLWEKKYIGLSVQNT